MGAPLEITRTDSTAEELRGLCGRCSDGAQVRRILALAMVLEGRSRTEAAELNSMDRQTLRDWVHRYNIGGIRALKSLRHPGRAPALTALQRAELLDLVIQGPDRQVHGVVRWRCVDLKAEAAFKKTSPIWSKPNSPRPQPAVHSKSGSRMRLA